MTTAHTPGPWQVVAKTAPKSTLMIESILENTGLIAVLECSKTRRPHYTEAEFNANLIATAPDLLAYAKCEEARACGEDIAETVLKQHGWNPAEGTSHEFIDRMRRAAIAKATGAAS